MRKMNRAIIALFAIGISSAAYSAAPAQDCEGLKVATGPTGKGYSKLFANMAKVCGSEVTMCEVTTAGGLDNLNALSTNEADVGLVSIDTLADMKNGDENIAALQAVIPLNMNYLHVVTNANGFTVAGEKKMLGLMKADGKTVVIQRFSDLKGQRVAVVGSAALLGRKLDRQLGYGMQVIDADSDAKAFDLVRSGAVAAAFTVSGWPSGTIKELKQDAGLTLVPFDAPTQTPYLVRPLNYKGMGVYNNNSLAMPNVMLTRPFKGEKASVVANLRSCVTKNLLDLQEGSFEPGWKEIKDINNTYDIPKFAGASVAAKSKKK